MAPRARLISHALCVGVAQGALRGSAGRLSFRGRRAGERRLAQTMLAASNRCLFHGRCAGRRGACFFGVRRRSRERHFVVFGSRVRCYAQRVLRGSDWRPRESARGWGVCSNSIFYVTLANAARRMVGRVVLARVDGVIWARACSVRERCAQGLWLGHWRTRSIRSSVWAMVLAGRVAC